MKKGSTMFLQAVIVLIGVVVLAIMIRFPLTEGRAANLDLFHIYFDPFIIYGYVASIAFFVALYQVFKLLGNIGRNKVFSLNSMKSLKIIKYCAIILSVSIVMAALYIKVFHSKDDDPVGFIAIAILAVFASIIIAIVTNVFEKKFQSVADIKIKK
jgi:hypothetical protein